MTAEQADLAPTSMDAEVVRRWFCLAAEALAATRSAIDMLNVFPVPDADTGTNLHATMASAAAALGGLPPHAAPAEIWHTATAAALRDACGNSGIIMSQLLRGLGEICGPASPCDGQVVASALAHAAAAARAAVRRPVEGTVLTVADAAAAAAAGAYRLAEVASAAASGAREALARTEQQLGALAASGVVDAGGAGLCVVLDALSSAISGVQPAAYAVPAPAAPARMPRDVPPGLDAPAGVAGAIAAAAEVADDTAAAASVPGHGARPAVVPEPPAGGAYEVTFLIDAGEQAVGELADQLDRIGDSLVVSGGGREWHVHVHAADAGAVIEAGLAAGRPSKITITFLNAALPGRHAPGAEPSAGAAMVADGAGLAALLSGLGAVVVNAGAGADPADLLNEIAGRPGPLTLVGPAGLAGLWPPGWPVVPVGSPVQVIAAAAVHDPLRDRNADADAMRAAVAAMRWGSVERSKSGFAGRAGGVVVVSAAEPSVAAMAVIDNLVTADTELVTILTGGEPGAGLREIAAERAAVLAPAAEVVCYDGGMSGAVLAVGAE